MWAIGYHFVFLSEDNMKGTKKNKDFFEEKEKKSEEWISPHPSLDKLKTPSPTVETGLRPVSTDKRERDRG